MRALEIVPVRALKDNYAYLVVDVERHEAAVVDASEADPVVEAARARDVTIVAIWSTHHHHDHVGGNLELIDRLGVREVVGSAYDGERGRVPGQTRRVDPDAGFAWLGREVKTIAIPAHTLGHTAYVVEDHVFCGDTLFGGGCGRLFEGTPAQMVTALSRLRSLPDRARVWCGHEYTLHNLEFAVEIEPDNRATRERLARVRAMPAETRCTVPLSLAEERATNPMLRWDTEAIQRRAGTTDPVEAFAWVRRTKDVWR
jgi:hydroxyacylglutathione hydrolase